LLVIQNFQFDPKISTFSKWQIFLELFGFNRTPSDQEPFPRPTTPPRVDAVLARRPVAAAATTKVATLPPPSIHMLPNSISDPPCHFHQVQAVVMVGGPRICRISRLPVMLTSSRRYFQWPYCVMKYIHSFSFVHSARRTVC
jgi:hypothetical protein